ncbi:MAG: hypothetical protein J6Y71_06945 [Ruminococcus sp.]|nr:hypothetical protein [Ruminococcus sp.]
MRRLTDSRTAQQLRDNASGLISKGFKVPIEDLRYIRLAEYEEREQQRELFTVSYDPDEEYYNND